MYYVAGWNLPGCLPEMEPATFYSLNNAKNLIIDELAILREEQYQKENIDLQDVEENYWQLIEQINHTENNCFNVFDEYSGLVFWIDLVPESEIIEN